MGLDTSLSETPIVPIVTGTMETTFLFWKTLLQAGIFTNPVVPPAVPEGSCLIRTSYMATHTDEHLETIVETVRKVARQLGLVA
jgi:8-amino-7-oxononanoate synthase